MFDILVFLIDILIVPGSCPAARSLLSPIRNPLPAERECIDDATLSDWAKLKKEHR